MSKQYNLFGEPSQATEPSAKKVTPDEGKIILVLDKKASEKDQKKKNNIDKKIKKIGVLKVQIERITKQLSEVKKIYNEKATKYEIAFHKQKEVFILKLFSRSKEKGFTLWQKDLMLNLIVHECNFLADNDYFSDEIKKVQEEIMELKAYELDDDDKDDLNAMYEDFFGEMDIDLDDDFDFSKMNDPEYQERIFEQFHQKQQEYTNNENTKARTAKVQKTDKEFQKLYKQLVRKVHPDLVTEEKVKIEREVVMKKLTEAWDNRNYYELLVLQKEIEGQLNTETVIGAGQLDTLTAQLNLEINKLEEEKWYLKSSSGENYFYVKNFFAKSKKGIERKVSQYILHIENERLSAKDELMHLKSKASTKRYLTNIYNSQHNNFNPFDFFDEI